MPDAQMDVGANREAEEKERRKPDQASEASAIRLRNPPDRRDQPGRGEELQGDGKLDGEAERKIPGSRIPHAVSSM